AYRALDQRDRSRAGEAADGLERVARAALAANDRAAVVSALAALRAVAPERPLGRYARLAALDATDRGDSAAALAILPSAVATAGDPRAADSLLYLYGMAAARARDCTTAVAAFEGVSRRTRPRRHPTNREDDASLLGRWLDRRGRLPRRRAAAGRTRAASRGGACAGQGAVPSWGLFARPRHLQEAQLPIPPGAARGGRDTLLPRRMLLPDRRSPGGGARIPSGRRPLSQHGVRSQRPAPGRRRQPAPEAAPGARSDLRPDGARHLPGAAGTVSRHAGRGTSPAAREAAA